MKAWQVAVVVASVASLGLLAYYLSRRVDDEDGKRPDEAAPAPPRVGAGDGGPAPAKGLKPGFLGKGAPGAARGRTPPRERDVAATAAQYEERVRAALERLSATDKQLVRVPQTLQLVHKLRMEGDNFLETWGLQMGSDDADDAGSDGDPFTTVKKQIQKTAERAFLDTLALGLSRNPPDMSHVLTLFLDVRDTLLRQLHGMSGLLGPGTGSGLEGTRAQLADQIAARLEEDYMRHKIVDMPADLEYLSQLLEFVVDVVVRMGSPAREDQIRADFSGLLRRLRGEAGAEEAEGRRIVGVTVKDGEEEVAVTPLAASMTEAAWLVRRILKQLQSDTFKFHMHLLQRSVEEDGGGAAYERRFFDRLIGDKTPAEVFPRCVKWLSDAADAALGPGGVGGVRGLPSGSPARVLFLATAGVLEIMQRPAPVGALSVPETLVLDVDALVWLQNQAQSLAVTAFLMLTARNFLVAKGCPPDLDFMDRLVSRFSVLLDSPTTLDFIIAEACNLMAMHVRSRGKTWDGSPNPGQMPPASVRAPDIEDGGDDDGRQDDRHVAVFLRKELSPGSTVLSKFLRQTAAAVAQLVLQPILQDPEAVMAGALGPTVESSAVTAQRVRAAAATLGAEAGVEDGPGGSPQRGTEGDLAGARSGSDMQGSPGALLRANSMRKDQPDGCALTLRSVGAEILRPEAEAVAAVVLKVARASVEASGLYYEDIIRGLRLEEREAAVEGGEQAAA